MASGTYTLTGIKNSHTCVVSWSTSRSSATSTSVTVSLTLKITCGTYTAFSSPAGDSDLCINGTWDTVGGSGKGGYGGVSLNKGGTWSKTYSKTITWASSGAITCQVYVDYYASGWGPSPDGGTTQSFTVSVPTYQSITGPTAGTTRASYSGNTFSISWSGFSAGTYPITRYELWYQSSTDNSTWSDRVRVPGYSTSLSYSYSWTGGTWNTYYRFCAVALDKDGRYSSTTAYSSSVRKYATACGAPSTINRSPSSTVYIRDTVTISWSGASNGTNNTINGYNLQYGTSTSSYSTKSVTTTSTSSSTTFVPTSSGTWYYRIQTKGTAGSSYYGTSTWRSFTVSAVGAPSTCRYVITEDGSNDVTGDTTAPSSRATIVNKTFKGTWTVGAGATSYQIRLMRRNDANTAWEEYSSTYYTSTTNSYTFSLPIRSSYPGTRRNDLWYNVRSVRNGYYSAWVGPYYGFSRSACVKIYNGSTWKNGAVWIFNGSKWIPARYVKFYNGSAWKNSKLY